MLPVLIGNFGGHKEHIIMFSVFCISVSVPPDVAVVTKLTDNFSNSIVSLVGFVDFQLAATELRNI